MANAAAWRAGGANPVANGLQVPEWTRVRPSLVRHAERGEVGEPAEEHRHPRGRVEVEREIAAGTWRYGRGDLRPPVRRLHVRERGVDQDARTLAPERYRDSGGRVGDHSSAAGAGSRGRRGDLRPRESVRQQIVGRVRRTRPAGRRGVRQFRAGESTSAGRSPTDRNRRKGSENCQQYRDRDASRQRAAGGPSVPRELRSQRG